MRATTPNARAKTPSKTQHGGPRSQHDEDVSLEERLLLETLNKEHAEARSQYLAKERDRLQTELDEAKDQLQTAKAQAKKWKGRVHHLAEEEVLTLERETANLDADVADALRRIRVASWLRLTGKAIHHASRRQNMTEEDMVRVCVELVYDVNGSEQRAREWMHRLPLKYIRKTPVQVERALCRMIRNRFGLKHSTHIERRHVLELAGRINEWLVAYDSPFHVLLTRHYGMRC